MSNRVALTLVFTLSFFVFVAPDVTVTLQLAPLALFAVLVYFRVSFSGSLFRALESVFTVEGLSVAVVLPILILGPSLASTFEKSFQFALLISLCLILARLYMAVVPIQEVMEAFFWSGILSVGIFLPMSFGGLINSVMTLERFSPFNFHPNLLSLLLAGYFCVMVWKFMTGGWRMKTLAGLVALICLLIIFLSSSRGSIIAIIAGCSLAAGMLVMGTDHQRRSRLLKLGLLGAVLLLVVGMLVQHLETVQDVSDSVDTILELSNDTRGVSSGFSGRFEAWTSVLRVFEDGTFLLGRGIRSSELAEKTIDNSYLVIVYETGLISLAVIAWRYFRILQQFVKGYFGSFDRGRKQFYLACTLLMAVFIVNNIIDRYLFGIGNPYSLVAFLLFAAPGCRVERRLSSSSVDLGSKRLTNWRASNA